MRISEGLEDILTSDVFGVLDYVHDAALLTSLLRCAKSRSGSRLPKEILDQASDFELHFWPEFTDGSVPDLIVVLKSRDDTILAAIVIECKFKSGLNRKDSSEKQGDKAVDGKEALEGQLTAYGRNLVFGSAKDRTLKERISKAPNRYLIYLTSHYDFPEDPGIELSVRKLGRMGLELLWLSWRDFTVGFEDYAKGLAAPDQRCGRMVKDIIQLLTERKKLQRFSHLTKDLSRGVSTTVPSALGFLASGTGGYRFKDLTCGMPMHIDNMPFKFVYSRRK
jgi:hypothetical protein